MKHLSSILLLFAVACHSSDKETLLFLDDGMERFNKQVYYYNGDFYSMFAAADKENPKAVKPFKSKTDSIELLSKQVFLFIDSIKAKILEDEGIVDLKTVAKKDYLFAKSQAFNIELKNSIQQYLLYIDKVLSDTAKIPAQLNFSKELGKENKAYSFYELNCLENKIRLSNNFVLSRLFKNIDEKDFRFNKRFPVVIPKNAYLRKGELFQAKVFLTFIDTNYEFKIVMKDDTIDSKNGVAHFEMLPENCGMFNYPGILEMVNPKTREIMQFPFKIKFQIKNK